MYEILEESDIKENPQIIVLKEAYPNPFTDEINISYTLKEAMNIEILIYDQIGRLVKSLLSERQSPGLNRIYWDGKAVGPGIYYYRIASDVDQLTGKIVFVK
jgi:flagellar hook assembly protein FlgD